MRIWQQPFDIQAIILKFETHLVPCWPQELPVEHTEAIKIHRIN